MVVVNQVENVSVMQRSCMKARYAKHPFITTTASLPFLSRITGTEGGAMKLFCLSPDLAHSPWVVAPGLFHLTPFSFPPSFSIQPLVFETLHTCHAWWKCTGLIFLHGWGTAALLAFFTYIYEIWYTCVSYEDLQKSLLGPWSKPNRKSDIWNLVAFFLRLTCSIMLSLLRHFFSTWHRKSDEILMFFRLLYFQYCDNFVCGP